MLRNLGLSPSLVASTIVELRDVHRQSERERFRANVTRLGRVFGYEISKTLRYESQQVTTPLGAAAGHTLAEGVVVATILRAGLPLHQGILEMLPDAESAFLAAARRYTGETEFVIDLSYRNSPKLVGKTLIVADPMLATGESLIAALRELEKCGAPSVVHVAAVIASARGIARVEEAFPKVTIWTAAVDEELDRRGYIVPGLGDAGDLSFGGGGH